MPFMHKLSCRLALMKNALIFVLLGAVGCEQPIRLTQSADGLQLAVIPNSVNLQPSDTFDLMAVAYTSSGDTANVPVKWSMTGGTMVDSTTKGWRHYAKIKAGQNLGTFKVIAQGTSETAAADTAVVTVAQAPVASVLVSPALVSLLIGVSVPLTATPLDADGYPLSGRTVTWSSSNSAVASVNGSGLVTGVVAGTATITATSEGQSGAAAVTVTVTPVASVAVTPSPASVQAGQTVQLTATAKDANGTTLPGRPMTWASSNTTVAAVSTSGLVLGKVAGSATITATSEGQTGSSTLTVTAPAGPAPVATVTVTPASITEVVGGTAQLTAALKDSVGNPLTGRTVTWASSNTTVATVSSSGLVTGRAAGSATITATSEGKVGSSSVTVTQVAVASVAVAPASATIPQDQSVQLTATPKDAAGNTLAGRVVTWLSSAPGVCSVSSNGLVIGVGPGTATVTATSEGVRGTAAITVTQAGPPPPPPDGECAGSWPVAIFPRMPQSTGQAFYVSPSGSDGNSGTISAPWQTLQKAFDALQPGQTAYLRAGTYGAFCSASTFSRAGTPSAPITVRGYQGERAVIHGQVRLPGQYFRLSHVVVEGPSCGTWGATSQQGENLVLMDVGTSAHIEVSHSEIFHGGWHAGIAAGGDTIYVLNNYIHDNGGFNDPGQWNTSHAIYWHDGTGGVVANNILEHNRAKGLSARYSGNHVLVINNTVVGNGRSGMDIAESTHDWTFANNVVMNNGNVAGGVGINTGGSSGNATNVEINNVFWNNGTSGDSHWDTNATIINPKVADPLFVNPMNSTPSTDHAAYANDYHLLSGSPAIDFGSLLWAPPFDLAGVCRVLGAGPDAGAYER